MTIRIGYIDNSFVYQYHSPRQDKQTTSHPLAPMP